MDIFHLPPASLTCLSTFPLHLPASPSPLPSPTLTYVPPPRLCPQHPHLPSSTSPPPSPTLTCPLPHPPRLSSRHSRVLPPHRHPKLSYLFPSLPLSLSFPAHSQQVFTSTYIKPNATFMSYEATHHSSSHYVRGHKNVQKELNGEL